MLVFGPAVSAEDLLEKSERINKACLRCHAAVGINADLLSVLIYFFNDFISFKSICLYLI